MAEYIDKAQAQTELMMNAERYTIAHESGGFGRVEWSDNLIPINKAIEIIRNMPSIEDVPVLRCKDCLHSTCIDKDDDWWECEHDHRVNHGDGFCNWAERKENE